MPILHRPRRSRPAWLLVLIGAVAATLLLAGGQFARTRWGLAPAAAATGGLTIETRPAGADVLVDGEKRGVSPLTLTVAPGAHTIAVRLGDLERSVPVTVAAGGTVAQYIELSATAPEASLAVQGGISVVTTPPGARVSVDGQVRGVSPLTIADLAAGEHRVTVESDAGRAARVVSVQPGATAAVVFALTGDTGPLAGWLTVASPFEVQVMEGTEVVGVSATSRIMLTAGRHEVQLVNPSLDYSQSARIDISPGRVTTFRVEPPKVGINVNARPWADVLIDNVEAGQTPIANLPVAVGTHQVIFRHPQLGERRQTIVVTAKGPNRVSVDLHHPVTEMSAMKAIGVFGIMVALASPAAGQDPLAAGQDPLAAAKDLYAAASYEEALTTLTRLSEGAPPDVARQIEQYPCVLAVRPRANRRSRTDCGSLDSPESAGAADPGRSIAAHRVDVRRGSQTCAAGSDS